LMGAMAAKNKNLDTSISFLGTGMYEHAIPSVVPHLQRRSEFGNYSGPRLPGKRKRRALKGGSEGLEHGATLFAHR